VINTNPNTQGTGFLRPWRTGTEIGGQAGIESKKQLTTAQQQPTESLQLSSDSHTVQTRSGINAEYIQSSLGTALKASIPAGTLLPTPILLESFQGEGGNKVQAYYEKDGEKMPVKTETGKDGRVYMQLDSSPNAPLLMFDPGSLDYGLLAQSKTRDDGSTHRTLTETVHADGSRTLVQDHKTARDGSQSYHQVEFDAQGQARGGAVQVDSQGRRNWTEMKTSLNDRGGIVMQGESQQTPRSLLDHTIDSFKNPFSFKSPLLSWLKDKKQAGKQATTAFASFSQAATNNPGMLFPNLLAMLRSPSSQQAGESSSAKDSSPVSASPSPVKVLQGDITQIPADGIMTTVNSGGAWYGALDRAISRVAGGMYHGQLDPGNLKDGQVVVAGQSGHTGANFKDVVFVVDDLQQPLGNLVYQGLKSADEAGLKSVNLPAFRTGVMAGAMESKEEAVKATAEAIRRFQAENPSSLKDIQVVVHRDPELAKQFERALAG
jgi:O-acetyl-ADP-ribose deacetylase (regulator of RNase III)